MKVDDHLYVALVDDEPLALEYLQRILMALPQVSLQGAYRNGREAVTALQRDPVDLLFLDIHMPGFDGFDVVKRLQSDIMPAVVFATAYDDHAVAAFEHNAVDYVLKPFDEARIRIAVERARERVMAQRAAELLDGVVPAGDKMVALEALDSLGHRRGALRLAAAPERERLPIKDGQQTQLVCFADIGWVEAAGDYMCVHVKGQTHVLRSTMKELEQKLTPNFVRIHRSTIVNLDMVESVDALPKGEARLNLTGGAALKVSRNYRAAIQHILS